MQCWLLGCANLAQIPSTVAAESVSTQPISYKAVDAFGNGVPNIDVTIAPIASITAMYYPHIPQETIVVSDNTGVSATGSAAASHEF